MKVTGIMYSAPYSVSMFLPGNAYKMRSLVGIDSKVVFHGTSILVGMMKVILEILYNFGVCAPKPLQLDNIFETE